MNGVLYCNDGDWVESCTALVEHFDGRLELINWIERWALDPLSGAVADEPEIEVSYNSPISSARVREVRARLRRVAATSQRCGAHAGRLAEADFRQPGTMCFR